jgi:hypothetical protein
MPARYAGTGNRRRLTVAYQTCITIKKAPGCVQMLSWATRFLATVLIVGGALSAFPSTALGVTGQQAIAFLNAQRAANGLPGGIVENPEWSEGCRLHVNYIALNGGIDLSNPHDEEPGKPGFTSLGQEAARSAVLGATFGADGSNGWEDAPIHLMQTLAPGLSVTGYADGCLWTWPGYQRAAPEQTALYSYPNNTAVYYTETAGEWPYVPGEFVGLPQNAATGPYLYVFAFGQNARSVELTSASLTGPDGPVEVRTVDDTTSGPKGDLGGYLPPGGMVIPVSPLRPDSLYTANVIGMSAGQVLTWTWSFRTIPKPKKTAALGVNIYLGTVRVSGESDAPATLTVSRLPSQTLIWRTTVNPNRSKEINLRSKLDGGHYELCLDQAESSDYSSGHACQQFIWRAPPGVRWGTIVRHGSRVRLTLRLGAAAGELARVVLRPRGKRATNRLLRLPAFLVLWTPRGTTVTLTVPQFAIGERLYAATHLTRLTR